MEREQQGTAYETGGYGQQTSDTGVQQPREYASEYGTGSTTGTGSLADSMRSALSTRPGLGKYEEHKQLTTGQQPTTGERIKAVFTGRSAEEQQGYDQGRSYEQGRGGGYGTTTGGGYGTTGGTQQPTTGEKIKAAFTGRSAEEQQGYDQGRGYEQTRERGYGTTTGGGGYGTGQQQPTTGEKIKAMFTGRSAEEQHGYDSGRGYEQRGGYDTRGSGYGTTTTGGGQPTVMERLESTFTGRSAQEQHDYDMRQRQEREMQRERSRGSSEPGVMSQLGGMLTGVTSGMFGPEMGSHKPFRQRWHDSVNEIRTSLTGKTGETTYPMTRSSYGTQYGTPPSGRGY